MAGTTKGSLVETSEVLNRAADLIEERGWRRGGGWVLPSSDPADHLCLEGGIQAAAGIVLPEILNADAVAPLMVCPAYRAVCSYLDEPGDDYELWLFNDRQSRTAAEVIEVLRACAVIEAAREEQEAAEVTYASNLAVSA